MDEGRYIDHLQLVSILKQLKKEYKLKEEFFNGFYSLFELELDQFDNLYELLTKELGDRESFDSGKLETTWHIHTDKFKKITFKLYQEHLEVFIDIPTNAEELAKSTFEISKPEEKEYLLRRKEAEKEKLKRLNSLSEKDKAQKLVKIRNLSARRIDYELDREQKRRLKLDQSIDELEKQRQDELKKLEDIESEIDKEKEKIKREKELEKLQKNRKEKENNLIKLKQQTSELKKEEAKRTLPVGYDYDAKFYEHQLNYLRSKYGQDDQIDNLMVEWTKSSNLGNREHRRLYSKNYVNYYKVKYEGVEIFADFDNPTPVKLSFEEYLEKRKEEDFLFWVGMVLFVIVILFLASFFDQ